MAVHAQTIEQITGDFSISIETLARFLDTTSRTVMRWKKEGGKRPLDLLAKGQYDRLLSAIAQLEEGVFV